MIVLVCAHEIEREGHVRWQSLVTKRSPLLQLIRTLDTHTDMGQAGFQADSRMRAYNRPCGVQY